MSNQRQRPRRPVAPSSEERTLGRRGFLMGVTGALGARVFRRLSGIAPRSSPSEPPFVPRDPTKVPGHPATPLGHRSPFEHPRRELFGQVSATPLQDLEGIITPTDLHYERHHNGVAMIDPAAYTLLIHGMVERPTIFTLEELKRFPSISRILFLECSGNYYRNAPEDTSAQNVCGLTSTNEWTGVLLTTLFREVGVRPEAKWFLAEGSDAAVMARSIPVKKALDDAMVAYGQNGEALRPENGYPARLLCPGWEGNTNLKATSHRALGPAIHDP